MTLDGVVSVVHKSGASNGAPPQRLQRFNLRAFESCVSSTIAFPNTNYDRHQVEVMWFTVVSVLYLL